MSESNMGNLFKKKKTLNWDILSTQKAKIQIPY